jgi:gamma-D-glutamyl-L-lysine dipeptidyl-peptidase
MFKYRIFLVALMLWHSVVAFTGNNDLKTVNRVIDLAGKKYAPDKRTAIFDLMVAENSGQIVLKGNTNLPEAKRQVLDSLSMLGISYRDSVIIFPEQSLGEKTWGIVTLSSTIMRSGPEYSAEMVSEAMMGTPVKVLRKKNYWFQIQTPDQYLGWIDSRGITQKTETEMTAWKKSRRFVFVQLIGHVIDVPGKNALNVSDLVMNNIFEVISEVSKYLQIRLPDGRTGFVNKSDCISFQEWANRKPEVRNIISVARQLLGVPYVWGGTTCKGVDCSGMTKTAFYSQGIILARDASQQGRYGEHLDFNDLTNLQPGDLLFFGRSAQRITHVGLYLGNDKYINSSGLVRYNNINPKSTDFGSNDRKDFVAANRIINSLNTEGITLVKDHPWYNVINQK